MESLIDYLWEPAPIVDEELLLDSLPYHEKYPVFSDSGTVLTSAITSSNWSDVGCSHRTFWPSLEEEEKIRNSTEVKIDGFAILGKTWNIVKNNALTTVLGWTKVTRRTKLFMKGMPEICEKAFIYEIELSKVDNSVLSLIFTADTDQWSVKGRKKHLVYKDALAYLTKLLLDCIKTVAIVTRDDVLQLATTKNIAITSDDWEAVGSAFSNQLNSPEMDDRTIFPPRCQFWFICYQFGQDANISTITDAPEHYPHIRLQNAHRKVVHIAFDQHLPGHFLWFPKDWIFHKILLPRAPTYSYNVGLVNETGNFTYTNWPDNNKGIAGLHLYTRVFQSIHKNVEGFFNRPQIARIFLKLYLYKLVGKTYRAEMGIWKPLLDGKLERMKEGIIAVLNCYESWKARMEFVWTDTDEGIRDMKTLITKGATNVQEYAEENNFLIGSAFVATPFSYTVQKFVNLIQAMFGTIEDCRRRLKTVLAEPTLYKNDEFAELLSIKDFARVYLCEAILKRFFRGTFQDFESMVKKGPKVLQLLLLDEEHPPGWIHDWPFTEKLVHEDKDRIQTTLSVLDLFPIVFYRVFREVFTDTSLKDVLEDFKELISSNPNITPVAVFYKKNEKFYNSLVIAIISHCLLLNGFTYNEGTALSILWNLGKYARDYKGKDVSYTIITSTELHSKLSDSDGVKLPGLAGLKMFLQYAKEKNQRHQKGGTKLSIAFGIEEVINASELPFALEIPKTAKRFIVVPIHFKKVNNATIKIYVSAFERAFGRKSGLRKIHVRVMLRDLLMHFDQLPNDLRPVTIHELMGIVNRLLDDDSVIRQRVFKKQTDEIQTILMTAVANAPRQVREPIPVGPIVPPHSVRAPSGTRSVTSAVDRRSISPSPSPSFQEQACQDHRIQDEDSSNAGVRSEAAILLHGERSAPAENASVAAAFNRTNESHEEVNQGIQPQPIIAQEFLDTQSCPQVTFPIQSERCHSTNSTPHLASNAVDSNGSNYFEDDNPGSHIEAAIVSSSHVPEDTSRSSVSYGSESFSFNGNSGWSHNGATANFNLPEDTNEDGISMDVDENFPLINDTLKETYETPTEPIHQAKEYAESITNFDPTPSRHHASDSCNISMVSRTSIVSTTSMISNNSLVSSASVVSTISSLRTETASHPVPFQKESNPATSCRVPEDNVSSTSKSSGPSASNSVPASGSRKVPSQRRYANSTHSTRKDSLNVSLTSSVSSSGPRHMYDWKETKKLFVFMHENNLLMYMKGRNVCKLMGAMGVVGMNLPWQGIQSRIKTVLQEKHSAMLRKTLGRTLYDAVLSAVRDIKERFQNHRQIEISAETIRNRFNVNISIYK